MIMESRRQPHVLVISYPAQGHVKPLMKLSLQIASRGIKVTFVNTEFIHSLIMATMPPEADELNRIRLVSVPDGMPPEADRNSLELFEAMERVMSTHVRDLIQEINQSADEHPVTCVIADLAIGWALEVAKEVGILGAVCCPTSPGTLAITIQLPRLIEDGIVGTDGSLLGRNSITLSTDIPAWSKHGLPWSFLSNPTIEKFLFEYTCKGVQAVHNSQWVLCNTFYELDPAVCHIIPKILPIFTFPGSNHLRSSTANFWPEDSSCLDWLDKQRAGSVIYIAFGSMAILGPKQVEELALALEITALPFLWVIRSNLMHESADAFPKGFMERVADRGKFVKWTPQEQVLAHPSVACFISHCGWNSTVEGLSAGVPFLCWPHFSDQFHDKSYICDVWKIGLGLDRAEDGIITRHEISSKIMSLLGSEGIKENVLRLKEKARKSASCEGESSYRNLETFVEEIKKLSS